MLARVFLVCVVVMFSVVSCSKKTTTPITVKTPAWIHEYNNKYEFSAIGITVTKQKLQERIKLAEANGLENLVANILVDIENFLSEETVCFPDGTRQMIISNLLSEIKNNVTLNAIKDISRREALWSNPNDSALYVLMIADKKMVSKNVILAIETIRAKYVKTLTSPEILRLLTEIKQDIAYNNFIAKKQDCSVASRDKVNKTTKILVQYGMDANSVNKVDKKGEQQQNKNNVNLKDEQQKAKREEMSEEKKKASDQQTKDSENRIENKKEDKKKNDNQRNDEIEQIVQQAIKLADTI